MNKKTISIIIVLFLLPLIVAEESFIFKQNSEFTLNIGMANNNLSDCLSCSCSYSIFYPNGSSFIIKEAGTNDDGFCIYSNNATVTGTYGVQVDFNDSIDNGKASFEFEVTPTGKIVQTGMLIIYGVIVLIVFGISCIFFILAFRIQDSSLKIFFWLAGFIFLTGCMATVTAISYNINTVSAINKVALAITYIVGIITTLIFALVLVQRIISILDMMREKKGYETDF